MPKSVSVADLAAGQVMAISPGHSAELLALSVPAEAMSGEVVAAGPVERFDVSGGVAVMPVRGVLTPNSALLERYFGWATYHGIEVAADELAGRDDVRAVVVDLDSPGGYVLALEAAAEAMARLAAVKPVVAFVNPLAASAAYWLASQASEIVMAPGAAVGSIGVGLSASSVVGPGGNGVQWADITSSHARAKWPDHMTEEGRAEFQRSLDEDESKFHAAVALGRGIDPAELAAVLSVTDDPRDGGAVFGGAEAVTRRLADRVQSRSDFFAGFLAKHGAKPKARATYGVGVGAKARAASAKAAT